LIGFAAVATLIGFAAVATLIGFAAVATLIGFAEAVRCLHDPTMRWGPERAR
jgi:hypothetical protein